MLKWVKKWLKLKVYVSKKWEFLKTSMMMRLYKRFVFWKNSSILLWSLFTGDLSVLIYSLGVDLDTLLGRPQTWLEAWTKAKEEIEELRGGEVEETRWEKTKRFIYDYRWYLVGTVVVLSVGFIWIFTGSGGAGTPPTENNNDTATLTEDVLPKDVSPKAPLVLPETHFIMDQLWLQAHTDEFSQLKEGAIILEEVLPAGLPQQIQDINTLNETSSFLVRPIELTEELTVAQILTRDAPGNIVSYYILPMPESFQEDPLIQEVAANALMKINLSLAKAGSPVFEDASFVAIVNPESSRGTLFLEYSSLSNIRWQYMPLKK